MPQEEYLLQLCIQNRRASGTICRMLSTTGASAAVIKQHMLPVRV